MIFGYLIHTVKALISNKSKSDRFHPPERKRQIMGVLQKSSFKEKTAISSRFNTMGQAIASMKQYQQMGNTGAIAILQIKETEQAFKSGS
ncbi:MAG: hypothetical protein V7K25_13195 [Nostoc sp.]|uniref:hypothetical protein n=1 Tax=Nostoc sp. TaxID=1180 RepID=UPI002FFBA48A